MNQPFDIYIVHTPLHILFTLNLIRHDPANSPTLVFVIGTFPNTSGSAERLQHILGHRHRVIHLPGPYGHAHQSPSAKVFRHVTALTALHRARRAYRAGTVRRLLVYNDARNEVQAIIHDLRKRGVEQVLYVEDGIGAYYESSRRRNAKLVPILKILYRGAELITTHGAYSGTDGALVIHPELANRTLQSKTLIQMPHFQLDADDINQLLELFGGLPQEVDHALKTLEPGVLICLPSALLSGEPHLFAARINQTIAQIDRRLPVYLKYHPGDSSEQSNRWVFDREVVVVPRVVPAELFCAAAGDKLAAVYGEASSILITSRWIKPDIEAHSVNWTRFTLPPEVIEVFARLQIHNIEM